MRDEKGRFKVMRKDLTGKKYNMLTALNFSHKDNRRKTYWDFKCDCGNIKTLRSDCVLNGSIQSCGCMKKKQDEKNLCGRHKQLIPELQTVYANETVATIYGRWASMKSRCYDVNNRNYKHYGGRGIKVCDEWLYSFSNYYYWCINNGYKKELQIDRINNDGNYEPSNCRFVTPFVNVHNRRCSKKQANTEIIS